MNGHVCCVEILPRLEALRLGAGRVRRGPVSVWTEHGVRQGTATEALQASVRHADLRSSIQVPVPALQRAEGTEHQRRQQASLAARRGAVPGACCGRSG